MSAALARVARGIAASRTMLETWFLLHLLLLQMLVLLSLPLLLLLLFGCWDDSPSVAGRSCSRLSDTSRCCKVVRQPMLSGRLVRLFIDRARCLCWGSSRTQGGFRVWGLGFWVCCGDSHCFHIWLHFRRSFQLCRV